MSIAAALPPWLRWALLLPTSLLGGFIAGCTTYLMNAGQAANPDAPILFMAGFLGGLVSNLAAFYIAHELAPTNQRRVLIVFVALGVIAGIATICMLLAERDYRDLVLVAGNLVACYIAWRKSISEATNA